MPALLPISPAPGALYVSGPVPLMAAERRKIPVPVMVKLQAPFKTILPKNVPGAERTATGRSGVPVTSARLPSVVKVQLSQVKTPPTNIYSPVLSHLKKTVFPVLLVSRIGSGGLSVNLLEYLIMYPLNGLLPPVTSAVKAPAVRVRFPSPETVEFLALTSNTPGLPLVAEMVLTISLEEGEAKLKPATTSVAPTSFLPKPPPMLPPSPTVMRLALLKSPEPPKNPPVTLTLPVKLLAPLIIVEPLPD